MAFTVDYNGASRKRILYAIQRESDGFYWNAMSGWDKEGYYNVLPEQAPGHYSAWMTSTTKGDNYTVAVRPSSAGMPVLKAYTCDSTGKPVKKKTTGKGKSVSTNIVDGTLYVDGKKQTPDVVYEEMSSNGVTKYTAIKWGPSMIASCNCPGWTTNAKHKGKAITERTCKHTKKVATMAASHYLVDLSFPGSNLPHPGPAPSAASARTGRGIELD